MDTQVQAMLERFGEELAASCENGSPSLTLLSREEIRRLLTFDVHSPEARAICALAETLGRQLARGRGLVFAQIGIDGLPCPGNCRYCAFAACNLTAESKATAREAIVPIEHIVELCQTFKTADVDMISLMTTEGFGFERFLSIATEVRRALGDGIVLMANTGDLTCDQCESLRKVGVQAVYHAHRIGEGTITGIDPATRQATFEAIKASGLALMAGIEPLYQGIDLDAVSDRIVELAPLHPFATGVCGLINAADTAMESTPTATVDEVRFVAAVLRLSVGAETPFGCVGGIRWVDAGTDPRSRGFGETHEELLAKVKHARARLRVKGWHYEPTPFVEWLNERIDRNDRETNTHASVTDTAATSSRSARPKPAPVTPNRAQHQPSTRPLNPPVLDEAQRAALGRDLGALVLADNDAEDCFGTVDFLRACGFETTEIVLSRFTSDAVIQAITERPSVNDSAKSVSVSRLTADDIRQGWHEQSGFDVFNLPAALLASARGLARAHKLAGVLVIPALLPHFGARHLASLRAAFDDHPDADVIASWITWLNRPPYLLRARALDAWFDSDLCQPRPTSDYRPAPQLSVYEVVFGEEQLTAHAKGTDPLGPFFKTATLSALEAVRLVRADKDAASARKPEDQLIIDAAREIITALDAQWAATAADDQRELKRWDRWAHRNKQDFPIFATEDHRASLVYLDSAATTQRLASALEAQHRFDAYDNANVYRGGYPLSLHATAAMNDARAVIEKHIGAQRRQTILTANTSASAALVATAWGDHQVRRGDTIVVPGSEHHSNLLPWKLLAARKEAEVIPIPLSADGRLDLAFYERVMEAEGQRVKLVCLAHISNMMGLRNPVEAMTDTAHRHGARVFLDAAQSFAHLPIDVEALGVDFLAFSAHKAYGPMGLGCLWVAPEAFEEMDPVVAGGGTVSHASLESYYLRMGAIQYELGTPPVSQLVGFAEAVRYLDLLGMDAIGRHHQTLTAYLLAGLRQFDGITVWGDHEAEDGQCGLVSFSISGISPADIARCLGKLGVCVRSGGHCALPLHASLGLTGSVRASFAVHTTTEDLESLLVALAVAYRLYKLK